MTSILVTGGTGQLGIELARVQWGPDVELLLPPRDQLDLSSKASIGAYFEQNEIAAVVNAAAYTAVDRAESEVAEAFAINAMGPALLAEAAAKSNLPLIQVSTDYVFSGAKTVPYLEDDAVGPLGVYGASKLAGEFAVLTGNPRSVVLRTAWVLSPHRSNFLKTVRRLSETRPEISVVADQIGCPTSAADIADAIHIIVAAHLASPSAPVGVYHFVNAGEATWCELANAAFQLSGSGAPRSQARPITSAEYPTAARRPANSRLATDKITRDFGVRPRLWRDAIAEIVAQLNQAENVEGHLQ